MRRGVLIRLLLCIFIAAFVLYSYIDRLNAMTQLKIEIPKIKEEVQILCEENDALKLQIERQENPRRLVELLREPRFRHLQQPSQTEIIVIGEP